MTSFVLAQHQDGAGKPLDLVRQGPPFPGFTLALDPADPFLARAAKARFAVTKEENGRRDDRALPLPRGGRQTASRARTSSATPTSWRSGRARGPGAAGARRRRPRARVSETLRVTSSRAATRQPGATITVAAGGSVTGTREGRVQGRRLLPARRPRGGGPRGQLLPRGLPAGSRETAAIRPVALARRPPAAARPRPTEAGGRHEAESEVVLSAPERSTRMSSSGRRSSTSSRRRAPASTTLIDYGWFAILVQAAPLGPQGDPQVRRKLGRRDPPHHGRHQGPPLPAHAQAARLDEEDERAAAEGGDDPREVGGQDQAGPAGAR